MRWTDLGRALRSGLGRVLAGALVVAAVGLLMYRSTTLPAGPQDGIVEFVHAEFASPDAARREVALPHTWARDGLPNTGRGVYRVAFQLERVPDQPWGLHASRLSSRHVVRLNGRWVHGSMLEAGRELRGVPVPTWIDIAADLLRPGDNLLEIEVVHDYRAGLSVLRLGPEQRLWPVHVRDEALHLTVPRSLNLFGIGLALFVVSIWWRRRSERAIGLFAALMLLLSLRNVAYSGTGTLVHTPGTDVFFYLANIGAAMLLAHFALAWAGRDWPWFRRAVNAVGVLLFAGGVGAVFVDGVQSMRVWTYPLLLASLVPSLVLMVLGTRREVGATRVALLAGVTMLCLAPLHDYFYIRGLTSVSDFYWMPFAAPITLIVFAWALLDRFVAALGAVEGQAAELELRVAQRTRELAEANAAKTRFLAAASHDLRQPVVSIGLLSGLLREQPLPAAARPLIDRIADSVSALNALLKGLLDLSRFEAGAVTPRRQTVALAPLLDAALADERELARRKGLALRVRGAGVSVLTDPLLAEQIVRNLVGNAVRYTERGGVLVALRRRGGDRVLLQVWDTGRGIAPEHQSRVFEEFVQVGTQGDRSAGVQPGDGPDRSGGGLGLGLALVRRAAQLQGLPLRLRSRPGRGSCFEIELPLAEPDRAPRVSGATEMPPPAVVASADAPATATPPGPPRTDGAALPLAGRCLWLVDDEPEVLEALRLRCVAWGASVRAFEGRAALLRAVDAFDDPASAAAPRVPRPDLLVTDQHLRDGTGLQAVARVLKAWPELPVLVITGDTAPADLALLQASGWPLLHKPFTGEVLLEALQQGLAAHADAAIDDAATASPDRWPGASMAAPAD